MKEIGILSMQEVPNFGSFLQAYGLKKTIENLGDYHVTFVPIEPGRIVPGYKRSLRLKIKKGFERLVGWDMYKRVKYYRLYLQKFTKDYTPELIAGSDYNGEYDCIVIGSDEVFHFAQPTTWGFTPQLYGDVKKAKRVISYAGSFGSTTIDMIKQFGFEDEIKKAMSHLSAVSVRDENSYIIASALTNKTIHIDIDPVLLFDYSNSGLIQKPKEDNYMVLYTYPNRINKPAEVKAITTFARKNNLRIISMGFYFPWVDEVLIPHPFEVLGYIRDAKYVVTDTFHGSVMSIINCKQFCTIVRNSNRQKMTSLLTDYGLTDRIVDDMNQLGSIAESVIDYKPVKEEIERRRLESLEYLKKALAD